MACTHVLTHKAMNQTVEVLRAESKRLRSLALKIDALIAELDAPERVEGTPDFPSLAGTVISSSGNPNAEFANLTQRAAIMKALEYGPQTTRELFTRLNAGGQAFRNPTYVSSVLARMGAHIRRTTSGKHALRPAVSEAAQQATG